MPRKARQPKQHSVTWRQFVKFTYPDILSRTYCVPPLHFNRVPYDRVCVPGIPTSLPALVQQTPLVANPGPSGASSQQQPSQTGVPFSDQQQPPDVSAPNQSQTQSSAPECCSAPVSNLNDPSGQSTSLSPSATISDEAQSASAPLAQGCGNSPTVHSTGQSAPPGSAQSPPSVSHPADPPLSDYSLWPIETHTTDKPSLVFHSDTLDDFSQQFLLYNLHALAEHLGEVMFILSSVNFKNYLTRAPAGQQFPLPRDIPRGIRGDFDFLLLHRHHGLLVGEMKSVGSQRAQLQLSEEDDDKCVVKRVDKAVKQLEKGREVVSHLVSDIVKGLPVRTSLFLPFVSQEQLKRVLTANPALAQEVCHCLGVSTTQDAVDMTLCSDDLSDPNVYWDVTSQVLFRLTSWWQRRMTSCSGQLLSDDQYIDIIGRFVGPATTVSVHCNARPRVTVEVRTEGEAMAELGMRLARLVLTPEQVDLLNRAPPRVYLTGPPGTGKSVMLILMAVVWLYKGWNVQVVSSLEAADAACRLVYHQIRKTLESGGDSSVLKTAGKVSFHSFHVDREKAPIETVVEELATAAQGQHFRVIMDEAPICSLVKEQVEKLCQADPSLYLWAAHINKGMTCAQLQIERMTRPLRSAPCVVRQIQRAVTGRNYCNEVEPYNTEGIPSPADGWSPTVIHHHGADHTGLDPISCYHCGLQLAATLHSLAVGKKDHLVPNSPDALQFRDVLILEVHGDHPAHDDLRDPEGRVVLPASDLVRALRAQGIPVSVLEKPDYAQDVWETGRWERHHRNGCQSQEDEDVEEDLGICALHGYETEEVHWEQMTTDAKKTWRLHFEECKVESKEEKEQWKTHRQTERKAWQSQLEDIVTARYDQVTVTTDEFIQGLERKVVVALMRSMNYNTDIDVLRCVSRCTTHLIMVHSRDSIEDPADDDNSDQASNDAP